MDASLTDLPVLDRVLVHLLLNDLGQRPRDPDRLTQSGIAMSIGIERKHVPRAIRSLAERDYVVMELAHVDGARQRKRLHRLTEEGRQHALSVLQQMGHAVDAHSLSTSPLLRHNPAHGALDRMVESAAADGVVDGVERRRLQLTASMLDVAPERLEERLRETGASIHEATDLDLTGEGAVWLACFETALADGKISPDEQALLTSLGASLNLTEAHVDAWLLSVLHDMMK